jgi:hypothetical protein
VSVVLRCLSRLYILKHGKELHDKESEIYRTTYGDFQTMGSLVVAIQNLRWRSAEGRISSITDSPHYKLMLAMKECIPVTESHTYREYLKRYYPAIDPELRIIEAKSLLEASDKVRSFEILVRPLSPIGNKLLIVDGLHRVSAMMADSVGFVRVHLYVGRN